ncbi:MAG: tetratricopeptide repeat protein [candidate division Zixibacteria bacterium]|nr:tetratricopeptide repeat protein [candidate division Zixibacteria bacterium]
MSDNLQNSKVNIAHQLEEIEKLIEKKDFVTALAQIREIQSTSRLSYFSLCADLFSEETGKFYFLATKVLQHLGSYEEALATAQRAISVFIELHNELKIAQTQYLLGLIYIALGNHKSAETEIRDALAVLRRVIDFKGVIDCLNKLSQVEFVRGSYSKSIEYLQEALSYCYKAEDHKKKAILYGNLGQMFVMIGNWKEAKRNLLLNISLNRQAKDELNLCRGLLSLGYIYFLEREFTEAKKSYEESLSLIQKNNCVRELAIYNEYSGELAFV